MDMSDFVLNLIDKDDIFNDDLLLDFLYYLNNEKDFKKNYKEIFGNLNNYIDDYILILKSKQILSQNSFELTPYGKNVSFLLGLRDDWEVDRLNLRSKLSLIEKIFIKDQLNENQQTFSIENKDMKYINKEDLDHIVIELLLDKTMTGYLDNFNNLIIEDINMINLQKTAHYTEQLKNLEKILYLIILDEKNNSGTPEINNLLEFRSIILDINKVPHPSFHEINISSLFKNYKIDISFYNNLKILSMQKMINLKEFPSYSISDTKNINTSIREFGKKSLVPVYERKEENSIIKWMSESTQQIINTYN